MCVLSIYLNAHAHTHTHTQALRVNPALVDVHNNLGDLWRAQVCRGVVVFVVLGADSFLFGSTAVYIHHACFTNARPLSPATACCCASSSSCYSACYSAQGPVGRNAAQQCYLEALRQDVLYAPAWRGLGDLLREGGEMVQALSCYQEAVRLRPCYADAFTGMGECLLAVVVVGVVVGVERWVGRNE